MPIPAEFLDELKARLDLVAIVSRHVALTRRGREHLGLCPFHQEKTPSFTVNEQKGFYHCFGCGAHGTAIDFVMQHERMAFRDAVAALASGAGLPMPVEEQRDRAREDRRDVLYAANEAAAAHFQASSQERRGPRRLGLPAPARPRRGADRPLPLGLRPGGRGPPPGAAPGRLCRRRAGGDRPGGSPGGSGPPALRALPRPGDVSHRGRPRADRRLRRPGDGRRPAQVPQHRRDRALPQGQPALRPRATRRKPRARRGSWWWWKATWT